MSDKKLKTALRKIRPLLESARKKDLNEADTRNLVERFLEAVLGYDLFTDLSAEEPVEHRAADYAVRIGKKIAFLVEIKAIQVKLKDNHVFQLKNYAASKGVPWCVLTNGVEYRLYHVDFSEAVRHDIVFEANVLEENPAELSAKLHFLTRRSLAKDEVEKYWRRQKGLSEEGLLEAVLSPRVLRAIRKQVQLQTRQRVSDLDAARGLKRMFAEQLYESYERLTLRLQRPRRRRRHSEVPAGSARESLPAPGGVGKSEAGPGTGGHE